MSKLTRGLVLGATLVVLSSATAAAAQPPDNQPVSRSQAVQQFRAGERTSADQPVVVPDAMQQFRAGERAVSGQPVVVADPVQQFRAGERTVSGQLTLSGKEAQQTLAAQRHWYYQSTQPAPVAAPARPSGNDTPVGLLAALAAAAVLSLTLDAMFVRRKARKATASTAI
jgi:hypothetical protein